MNLPHFCVLLGLAGPAFAQTPTIGTITGTIRYVGDLPASERVMLTDGQVILHNDVVVHAKTKGLRDVAVVLDWKTKVPADAKARAGATAEVTVEWLKK